MAMRRYVEQLLEDLDRAASVKPTMPYFEVPPEFVTDDATKELALIPYKTIEELSGIEKINFPHSFHLSDEWVSSLLAAIFKVLDNIQIELIDQPSDIPNEILYDVIVEHWDDYVQYLPSSGFDWEICSGNPDTCPYIGFCNCDEDFLEDDEPPENSGEDDNFKMPF